jgi:CrcB protein
VIIVGAAIAGAVASVARYLVSLVFAKRGSLPWAVFIVNVVGSAIGGTAAGLSATGAISSDLHLVIIGGVAGGLTTFSTWSVETIQLVNEGKWRTAVASVAANLLVGLAVASLAYALASAIS